MRLLIPALTLIAIAVLAAGCGSKKQTAATESTSSKSVLSTIRIVEKEFSLTPSTVTISKPGTYTIDGVNQGTISHAIAIDGQGVDESGPTVDPGGTSSITVSLTKPGPYRIFCPVGNHAAMGMEGTLTLAGTTAAGGGGSMSTTTGSRNGYG